VGDRVGTHGELLSAVTNKATCDLLGTGDRDLLPDNRAYCEFEAVNRPWHAKSRPISDERAEERILAECLTDCNWISVKIEELAAAIDGHREVSDIGELKVGLNEGVRSCRAVSGSETNDAVTMGEAETTTVTAF
jgi:hypothetical protein